MEFPVGQRVIIVASMHKGKVGTVVDNERSLKVDLDLGGEFYFSSNEVVRAVWG